MDDVVLRQLPGQCSELAVAVAGYIDHLAAVSLGTLLQEGPQRSKISLARFVGHLARVLGDRQQYIVWCSDGVGEDRGGALRRLAPSRPLRGR